ncbi:ATP-binding protein [Candidatus Babeliales bacterium]|nr:ATP-binding protein [Candidatus Babeliales bacterium]
MKNRRIGCVVSGSFSEGVVARLDVQIDMQKLSVGRFVCIDVGSESFLSLVTDLSLASAFPEIIKNPPREDEELFAHVVRKHALYVLAHIRPMLAVSKDGSYETIKTVAPHFASVSHAQADDIAAVFGNESDSKNFFSIGSPLGMDAQVCLNLADFVQRSNGIFGKTGTGKTFVTRTLLAGLVRSECAVNLVFDMHSEYGTQARSEGKGCSFVKGLKTLFPGKVAVFSLDPEATRRRGCEADVAVQLSFRDIRVQDVLLLQDELNLHSTALEAAYLLGNAFGRAWLETLLERGNALKELAEQIGAHPESISALYRKLKRLEYFPFLTKNLDGPPVVDTLLEYLSRGVHVILEFGRQTSMLAYLLIASIITRRIHAAYVAKTEKFLSSQMAEDEPQKLVITIEEAHKFLNPRAAKQTIFGMIAREMRKYYVSLLVVDQRPSCIDSEVLSQLGTKIVAQLSDDSDIQSVLTGVSGAAGVRTILATLGPKQQAFVMGHAVPLPVLIQTRMYDEVFYAAVSTGTGHIKTACAVEELFG